MGKEAQNLTTYMMPCVLRVTIKTLSVDNNAGVGLISEVVWDPCSGL